MLIISVCVFPLFQFSLIHVFYLNLDVLKSLAFGGKVITSSSPPPILLLLVVMD
jgi:hypothetical protein